jgi:pimeloyl-ACP methyl ester carboxylesterase
MRAQRRWALPAAALVAAACAIAIPGAPDARAADGQMLLVHGWGDAEQGTNCNGSTWANALRYYQDAGGRERSSMTTIGYYAGDRPSCDAMIGDGKATNGRPIQDIARDLAAYIYTRHTSRGESVDVVAHSMGGLITRVALLGTRQGWKGFPPRIDVEDVVTLGTPHQGVIDPGKHDDRQWRQMRPGSGFLERLHEDGSGIDDPWARGTEWTFVGSAEDKTVSYASAIDKGRHADVKFGYRRNPDDAGNVTHSGIRALYGKNAYDLSYWHAEGGHPSHHTLDGWSPLKAAFQAATKTGDGLPR